MEKAKNNELTWQMVRRIVNIADSMIDQDILDELPECCATEQGYYEEVLRRFNELNG